MTCFVPRYDCIALFFVLFLSLLDSFVVSLNYRISKVHNFNNYIHKKHIRVNRNSLLTILFYNPKENAQVKQDYEGMLCLCKIA